MSEVIVRPLQLDDLVRLHGWLNEPHLVPYYMRDAISLGQVTAKFTPRIEGRHHCACLVAEYDGAAFGYAQWYLNRDYVGAGISLPDRPDGVSIDYFIGAPAYLGRTLGHRMLDALVRNARQNLAPADRLFHIGHDDRNTAAIRCALNAGFAKAGTYSDKGAASSLFARDGRCGKPDRLDGSHSST